MVGESPDVVRESAGHVPGAGSVRRLGQGTDG